MALFCAPIRRAHQRQLDRRARNVRREYQTTHDRVPVSSDKGTPRPVDKIAQERDETCPRAAQFHHVSEFESLQQTESL